MSVFAKEYENEVRNKVEIMLSLRNLSTPWSKFLYKS